ncbi:MAG: DUF3120 domain-containing protein [Spirulinaceae cyanobacterium SM2_1_0]|nr:DUF3120 domain-containing protein [Spirulinaceae cyanobacterium SM2_1_0]
MLTNPLAGTISLTPPQRATSRWGVFAAAAFLVSVPVFFQAPLVRVWPGLSLGLSVIWFALAYGLNRRPGWSLWGDLLMGFSWTWLAGSLYWGWLRWEPLIHLPIEAIALPLVLWPAYRQRWPVGMGFYLGSLFGTAITDLYFYLNALIPYWRQVMQVEPEMAPIVFENAIAQLQTPWALVCALWLVTTLLAVGFWALQVSRLQRWALGGAVLSTILVDGVFWLAISLS